MVNLLAQDVAHVYYNIPTQSTADIAVMTGGRSHDYLPQSSHQNWHAKGRLPYDFDVLKNALVLVLSFFFLNSRNPGVRWTGHLASLSWRSKIDGTECRNEDPCCVASPRAGVGRGKLKSLGSFRCFVFCLFSESDGLSWVSLFEIDI